MSSFEVDEALRASLRKQGVPVDYPQPECTCKAPMEAARIRLWIGFGIGLGTAQGIALTALVMRVGGLI